MLNTFVYVTNNPQTRSIVFMLTKIEFCLIVSDELEFISNLVSKSQNQDEVW